MFRDFIFGFSAYFEAVSFIRKHRLWSYVIIPGLISLFIGLSIVGVTIAYFGQLVGVFQAWYPFQFGSSFVASVGAVLSSVVTGITGFFLYKYLVIIVASPFMSLLSEKVEYILNPQYTSRSFNLLKASKEFIRGLTLALRNIIRELSLTLLLVILGLVPVIGVISVPLIFLVQAFYAGFGNMDFYYERFYSIRQTVEKMKTHRFVTIGNGVFFLLLLMVPIAGLFLAPALGTVAGTLVCDQMNERDEPDLLV